MGFLTLAVHVRNSRQGSLHPAFAFHHLPPERGSAGGIEPHSAFAVGIDRAMNPLTEREVLNVTVVAHDYERNLMQFAPVSLRLAVLAADPASLI